MVQVALGQFQKLQPRERRKVLITALGLFSVPAIVVLIIVVGAALGVNVAANLPGWMGSALGGMFLVGLLLLFPERTLQALNSLATIAARMSPKLGRILTTERRTGERPPPETPTP